MRQYIIPVTIDIILNNQLIDDIIISKAQEIMESQFPVVGGWQNPLLCQSSFCPVVDESVQIHFTRQSHWVCSTSIGGYLRVFDSAGSKKLSKSMKAQLAEIYKSLVQGNILEVELPPIQIQNSGVDCGVFAIAFAYHLAAGMQVPKYSAPTTSQRCASIWRDV